MVSSSTLADTGSEVVVFPVPKLSTGSISRQFIGPDETAIMAMLTGAYMSHKFIILHQFFPLTYLSGIFRITFC